MKARPILFSAPMIRALLAGTKTQTRRAMRPQPVWQPNYGAAVGMNGAWIYGSPAAHGLGSGDCWSVVFNEDHQRRACTSEAYGWGARAGCPYGVPGDLLWVRETLGVRAEGLVYVADDELASDLTEDRAADVWNRYVHEDGPDIHPTNVPSIFMPRWASRLTLRITDVRVQRLQELSEADAKAEGAQPILVPPDGGSCPYTEGFRDLWDSINGSGAWETNPFCWCLSFIAIQRNVDEVLREHAN